MYLYHFLEKLVKADRNINLAKYSVTLEESFSVETRFTRFTIHQDSNLEHMARATIEWFKSKHIHVTQSKFRPKFI